MFDITPLKANPLGRARERPEANPLTYYERVSLIRDVLLDRNIPATEFGFVPFPIEEPASLKSFLPTSVTCFTTVCEDWNREKIRVLREQGYTVEVLWENAQKTVTGGLIRQSLLAGNDDWRRFVPPATVNHLERLGIAARLHRLSEHPGKEAGPANPTQRVGLSRE